MPKLTVVCLTYNHAPFIKQALEGFVMQKTNFPFEVIVHDDASTDGTVDIIREYEEKYPQIIKPIYQKENQWQKNKAISKIFIYPKITSEYVALCEGDDYWSDPFKLQKQVDFLDSHPDFSVCFHPVAVFWQDNSESPFIFPVLEPHNNASTFDLQDLLKRNFIQTNSVVYRWRFLKDSFNIIPENILPGDWFLHLLHAQVGKIGFLHDIMAVYRRHAFGIWYGAGKDPDWYCRTYAPQIRFCDAVEKQFNYKMDNIFYLTIYSTYYASLFLKNKKIQNDLKKYDFLPKDFKFYQLWRLYKIYLKYKKMYQKTDQNAAHYQALRLYLNWCKKQR